MGDQTQELFDDKDVKPPVTVDDLVGEDKKFKNADDLAAGKQHSDDFIEILKEERARDRQEIERLQTQVGNLSDLDKRFEDLSKNASESQVEATVPSGQDTPVTDERDLGEMVKDAIRQEREQDINKQNLSLVEQVLLDKFGDKEAAKKGFEELAKEFGTDTDLLLEVGIKSPQAIAKMLGSTVPAQKNTSPLGSTINTETKDFTGGDKTGTYSWYKKEYGQRIYTDQKLSVEIHNKAMRDPDFLKT